MISRTLIMGVDPGVTGAIALLDISTLPISLKAVFDIPSTKIEGGRRKVDLYRLSDLIGMYAEQTLIAFIEEVHSMPTDGVVQAFSFGFATGAVTQATASFMIPIHTIKPSVWKPGLGLSRDKVASRNLASKLFPYHVDKWTKVKDHGKAEAVLLAWYGARHILTKAKGA